jgi:1-acyl-sn-glycerol-3-phosphate acyltransferase
MLGLSPLLVAIGRVASRISGSPVPSAIVRLLLVYVAGELTFLSAAREERLPARLYTLLGRFLDDLVRTAMTALRLRLELIAEPETLRVLDDEQRPVLVFSRHAGGGDSVLLMHLLLNRFGRHPHIVLKQILAADPVVGTVIERLPTVPIDQADDCSDVCDLARGLDRRAALLIFPEGGNFTEDRRARTIAWLRRAGHHGRADRAERLKHVIAPRPGGALAAMRGAPDADVIFTAHAGLGRAAKGVSVLRELPHDRTVRLRLWSAPAAERPASEAERIEWLDAWWERLDGWLAAQPPE